MRVTLLGYTTFLGMNGSQATDSAWEPERGVTNADALAEFAGRACYQSWDRPNPSTAQNKDYVSNVLNQGHLSVFEHATAVFYIQDVSRALTHELIRHRHLSYSQLSQRYVAMSETTPVMPPAFAYTPALRNLLTQGYQADVARYEEAVSTLEQSGLPRKQAREAARAFLPNAAPTSIVVSGNHRAWREFLAKRNSPHADAEIQALAKELLRHLSSLAPSTYADLL